MWKRWSKVFFGVLSGARYLWINFSSRLNLHQIFRGSIDIIGVQFILDVFNHGFVDASFWVSPLGM